MKRALLKQMRYEWRDNVWLILGLAVVCTVVWFITLQMVGETKGLFYPLGADTDNVCALKVTTVPSYSQDYIDRGDNEYAEGSNDLRALISNVRKSPYVEAAAYSINALPYRLSYYGNLLRLDQAEKDSVIYYGNVRHMSPDMVRVLRLQSLTGKTEDELVQLLSDGNMLVSDYFGGNSVPVEEVNGKNVIWEDYRCHVADIIRHIKRTDYEMPWGGTIVAPINENGNFHAEDLAVRVKPGMMDKFREQFENDPSMQKHGNKILYSLKSMEEAAAGIQRPYFTSLRMTLIPNLLLVIIVALGIMGVFWFRIQQRIGETAIRKVCGATKADIFRRVISEGLILLLIAAVIMVAAGWPLLKATLLTDADIEMKDTVVAAVMTVALMAIAVVACIWLPARRAMKIDPAIAIKDE